MQARRIFWPLMFLVAGQTSLYVSDAPRAPEIIAAIGLGSIGLYFIARAAVWYFRRADTEEFALHVFTKPRGWMVSDEFGEDYPEAARYFGVGAALMLGAAVLLALWPHRPA
jgi:hypothetical protein